MKKKKHAQKYMPVVKSSSKSKPVQVVPRQLDPNLESSLDVCISRILIPPKERKSPLTQKQAHVGLEALIYKADHYSAVQGLTLEHASCKLQYRDKEGKEQIVSADINMKGNTDEKEN